ncbi:MAG TPA: hypothetical protein VN442_11125 [Bryobacteraceae bacterium]|nr:hypothetical protein [Bryobacteraceae bacterium]
MPRSAVWSPLGLAALAVVAVFVWLGLNVYTNFGGNWTGLFCTGGQFRVPPDLDAGTWRFPNSPGYDGQFYRYIAHDPFFQKGYAAFIDSPHFRYRRGLVPLLAWTLALGSAKWIDAAFIAVVLGSVFLGVYWSARYLASRGHHCAWGLVFLLLPATITSIDRMLTDAALAACFAGLALYAARKSWGEVYGISAAAALVRETGLLLAAGVVVYWVLKRRWLRAAVHGTAILPALGWYAFVAVHAHAVRTPGSLDFPLVAFIRRLSYAPVDPNPAVQILLQVLGILGLAGLLGSLVLVVRWAWQRNPGPPEICALLFAAVALVLGQAVMSEAYAWGRAVSPLLLFVMFEAIAAGAWRALIPPLLVTANVGITLGSQALNVVKTLAGLR